MISGFWSRLLGRNSRCFFLCANLVFISRALIVGQATPNLRREMSKPGQSSVARPECAEVIRLRDRPSRSVIGQERVDPRSDVLECLALLSRESTHGWMMLD